MENISKIEKAIIDYFLDIDSIKELDEGLDYESSEWISDLTADTNKKELAERNLPKISNITLAYGELITNTEDLLKYLLSKDEVLKNYGLRFDYDKTQSEIKVDILQNTLDATSQINESLLFRKISYIITKVPRFLNQLESNGYIDRVSTRQKAKHKKSDDLLFLNCASTSKFVFGISDIETKIKLTNSLNYHFAPTFKLKEFRQNGYFTTDLLIANKELLISNKNVKIARIGLAVSILSAIASIVAIGLTFYSIGIPATISIDKQQIDSIKETIENIRNESEIIKEKDSLIIEKTK